VLVFFYIHPSSLSFLPPSLMHLFGNNFRLASGHDRHRYLETKSKEQVRMEVKKR
jgi:hypothetical protein